MIKETSVGGGGFPAESCQAEQWSSCVYQGKGEPACQDIWGLVLTVPITGSVRLWGVWLGPFFTDFCELVNPAQDAPSFPLGLRYSLSDGGEALVSASLLSAPLGAIPRTCTSSVIFPTSTPPSPRGPDVLGSVVLRTQG